MKIMQIYLGAIINSAGGMEKVFCSLGNLFAQKHEVVNLISDPAEGDIFYEYNSSSKWINLKATKYTISLPLNIRLKHIASHYFRKYMNPKEDYYYIYMAKRVEENIDLKNIDIVICYGFTEYLVMLKTNIDKCKIIMSFHNSYIGDFVGRLDKKIREMLKHVGASTVLQEIFLKQIKDEK